MKDFETSARTMTSHAKRNQHGDVHCTFINKDEEEKKTDDYKQKGLGKIRGTFQTRQVA